MRKKRTWEEMIWANRVIILVEKKMMIMMIVLILMINPLKIIDEDSMDMTTYLPSKNYEDLNDVSIQDKSTGQKL